MSYSTYTPSPVSSKYAHEDPNGISGSSDASPRAATTPATEYGANDDEQYKRRSVPLTPTKGIWRYSPFQYMSLKPKITNPYVTTAVACMGGLLFGFGSTNLTPFIGHSDYEDYFGQFTAIDQSGMTASMPGGAMLGSIFSAFVGETIGRRGMVQFSAIIWMIGSAIQCAAINRESLSFGRIIASIGVGTSSSNVPMYLAEMVPPEHRGRFTSAFQLSVNLGILSMFFIGFGCHFIPGVAGWRLAWGLQMIPGFLMLIGTLFLHESPRWLASKGRWDETVEVLTALHHADAENATVKEELHQYHEDLEVKAGTFLDLFRKRNVRQTSIASFTMLIQQYCGCNAILYFSTSITSQVGYKGNMNSIMGSIDYIVLLGATIPTVLFADRVSRRYIFMIGSMCLLISLAVVAGIEGARGQAVGPEGVNGDPSVRWTVPSPHAAKAALAFSYIYLGWFSLSWGPAAWVYVSEIFNQDVRTVGNSFASVVNWLFNFTLTIYTETAFEKIHWKTYVIFAVFCALSIPVVFFFYPETRGYSLEQITIIFDKNTPAYRTDPLYLMFMKFRGKEPKLPEAVTKDPASTKEKMQPSDAEHHENVVDIE